MTTYAMVLNNQVIDILPNCENEPKWPPDAAGNPVIAIPCDDSVERGMVYDPETKTFSAYIPPKPETPQPTQLDRIEEQLTILTGDSVSLSKVETAITEGVNDV